MNDNEMLLSELSGISKKLDKLIEALTISNKMICSISKSVHSADLELNDLVYTYIYDIPDNVESILTILKDERFLNCLDEKDS